MNASTAKQIENMKKQTIGVEVEMYSITRENAAKVAADYFGTGPLRKHSRPERLQSLERMGCRGAGMEIPTGC